MRKNFSKGDCLYIAASELSLMHDDDVLFVHPAVISERLRCFNNEQEKSSSAVRAKLEHKLFSVKSVRRRTLCGWSERVVMTVSEVRILFGEIERLPLRALKRNR